MDNKHLSLIAHHLLSLTALSSVVLLSFLCLRGEGIVLCPLLRVRAIGVWGCHPWW